MTGHIRTRRRTSSTPSRGRPPAVDVPSTIWAGGTEPIEADTQWPKQIVSRAVIEFSRPGDQVTVVSSPAPTARRRRRFLTPDTKAALTTIEGLGRSSVIEHLAAGPATSRTPAPSEDGKISLILASLLPPENTSLSVVDEIVTLAATRLASGGVLVVFTRATHTPAGALLDSTGHVVSAGQTADLLFLQHIVAAPISDDTIVAPAPDTAGQARGHIVVHTDVTVLLRP
ncbi:hypothetical protein [Nocardia sp. NPDC019395]|uniref:hypothetical protein n=1 Tax=Nocardia sp. NPDC019395 TaxID=3154686 RepID=UPI0033CADF9B